MVELLREGKGVVYCSFQTSNQLIVDLNLWSLFVDHSSLEGNALVKVVLSHQSDVPLTCCFTDERDVRKTSEYTFSRWLLCFW